MYQKGGGFASSFTPLSIQNPYQGLGLQFLQKLSGVGAATKAQSSSASGADSSSSGIDVKETLSLLKNMEGLDSDVGIAMNSIRKSALTNNLTGSSSALSDYYRNIQIINKVKSSKDAYQKALEIVKSNECMGEAAITSEGKVVVEDSSGNLKQVEALEYLHNKDNYKIITNNALLQMRANDPRMAFNNSLLEIAQNGIGMDKIIKSINTMISRMGKTSQEDSFEDQEVQEGIIAIKEGKIETQREQAMLAIEAIYQTLPQNYRTLLKLKSDGTENGVKKLIADIVASKTSVKTKDTSETSSSGSDSESSPTSALSSIKGGLNLDSPMALALGMGYQDTIVLNPGTPYQIEALGVYNEFIKEGKSIGSNSTLQDATQSEVKGQLDFNQATMGGSKLSESRFDRVLLKTGDFVAIDLPLDAEALKSGKKIPDFRHLKEYYEIQQKIKSGQVSDPNEINKMCREAHLPDMFVGNELNTRAWGRFAAVRGTAEETAFENPKTVSWDDPTLTNASDNEREIYEEHIAKLSGDKKYKIPGNWLFGYNHLVEGTIFIPIRTGIMASTISGKQHLKVPGNSAHDAYVRDKLTGYRNPGPLTSQ